MTPTPRILCLAMVLLLAACREPNAPEPAAPAAATPPPATVTGDAPAVAVPSTSEAYPEGTDFTVGTFCNIEYLGDVAFDQVPLVLASPSSLRGWLGDEQGLAPRDVELRLVDDADRVQARVAMALGVARDDVAAAFPDKTGLAKSGFDVTLDPAHLPAGTWRLHLVYTAGEGSAARAMACDNGRRVTIAPAG